MKNPTKYLFSFITIVVIMMMAYRQYLTSRIDQRLELLDIKMDYLVRNTQTEYDSTNKYFKEFTNKNLMYYDSVNQITVAVESNGRRIYGIKNDSILWNIDPIKHMEIYRERFPVVTHLDKASKSYDPNNSGNLVSVSWSNSMFGTIHIATGLFIFCGQD